MKRGYVKLWRKALDNNLIKNHKAWCVFSYFLLTAEYSEHTVLMNGCAVNLKPGQIVTGRKVLSAALGLSEKEIRTAIGILEKLKIVAIQRANKYSIVSLVNWDSYQNEGPQEGQQKGQVWATSKEYIRESESESPQPPEGAIEFQPPSIEDVEGYIKLKGYRVDAREFFETNAANGWTWKKGKKRLPIKNWKKVLSVWNQNANKYAPRQEPLVLDHAEDIRKINSVVIARGPWFPLDDESDADFEKRFEEMVAECVALGVDENYVREGR